MRNLLLTTMPLALVAIGQTNALLVGGFDISVGALMTLCVVTASFTMTPGRRGTCFSSVRSQSSGSVSPPASSTRR